MASSFFAIKTPHIMRGILTFKVFFKEVTNNGRKHSKSSTSVYE